MKIIFDRSAFHGEDFDLLKGSRLSRLVRDREVFVFHTMVFLEETLRMIESHGDELKKQWPFLQSICNAGWFKPLLFGQPPTLNSVIEEELANDEEQVFEQVVQSHYDENRLLVPSCRRRETEATLKKLFETPGPQPELGKWRDEWHQSEQMKKENRELLAELRGRHTAGKGETFAKYSESMADEAAQLLIHKRLALAQADTKLDAWKRDPALFPHFSAYLEASVYCLYDADKNQNSPLDRNWQADAEQLCFLVDVDVIVSSDQRFMKRAFEELWRPRGKRMLNPEEFAETLA
jgi:hypothetical protein